MTNFKKYGFLMEAGTKAFFLETTATKRTAGVIKKLIDEIGKAYNRPAEVIEAAKNDPATLADFKRRTNRATLEGITTENEYKYFRFVGDNFNIAYPPEDFFKTVTVFIPCKNRNNRNKQKCTIPGRNTRELLH